jgi:hypothetical protein
LRQVRVISKLAQFPVRRSAATSDTEQVAASDESASEATCATCASAF